MRFSALALFAGVIALGACAGGDANDAATTADTPAATATTTPATPATGTGTAMPATGTTHTVNMVVTAAGEYRFEPAEITVKQGDAIKWMMVSGGPHNVAFQNVPEAAKAQLSANMPIPLAWLLLFAVVVAAGFEQGILALLPVYGTSHGIAEAAMSALLAVMIAGNIALQVPLGLLAERWSARLVRLGCVSATVLGCAALPFLIGTPLVWPFVFVWGALSYGIYTMTIIELGERFTGRMLVAGNAAFAMMWGVGGIAVPPVAGFAMDIFGPSGLLLTLGAMCLALALLSILRWRNA